MLSSSFEYLMALREGEYLRFLQWPAFVARKYGSVSSPIGGDALMDCLVFEWISYGYQKQDSEQMAVLYAVYESQPHVLYTGELVYQLTTTVSALFSCMAFHQHSIIEAIFPYHNLNEKQVCQFITEKTALIRQDIFTDSVALIRDEFMKRVEHLAEEQTVHSASEEIYKITRLLSIFESYEADLNLKQTKEQWQGLSTIRHHILLSVISYLRVQSEFTPRVARDIIAYVNLIRCQQPEAWEKNYLEQISPYSLSEKTMGSLTYFCERFFKGVMPKAILHPKDNSEYMPGMK